MGQAEIQLGMISQIADRANVLLLGLRTAHDQRLGVVEAQLTGHTDTESGQLARISSAESKVAMFQNLLANGAGVFRIKADLAAPESLPKDDCAAHALAMFADARVLHRALGDLGEHVRLGKFFRADDDRLRQSRCAREEKQGEQTRRGGLQTAHLVTSALCKPPLLGCSVHSAGEGSLRVDEFGHERRSPDSRADRRSSAVARPGLRS